MLKKIILFVCIFIAGICTAVFFQFFSLNRLELSITSPVVSEKEKPEEIVLGFLPYWLLPFASNSYSDTITTLTYFGLTLNSDGTIQKKLNPQEEEPGWTTYNKISLKEKLTHAYAQSQKISLLVHNSNEDEINIIIQQPEESARNLIGDIAPLMKDYHFNDLNIDIESFGIASSSAQVNFTTFIETVKKGLGENKLGTLTVEITPSALIRKRLIDPQAIGKIADYIVIMAYDYHYIYSPVSGPVAPLSGSGEVWDFDVRQTIAKVVELVPREKILLGVPLYGYEWEILADNPRSPVIPYSGKTASNRRIETILSNCDNCESGTDEYGQVPYIIIPETNYFRVIYYENQESLAKKISLIKEYHLGGIALWALGYEDSTILNTIKAYK